MYLYKCKILGLVLEFYGFSRVRPNRRVTFPPALKSLRISNAIYLTTLFQTVHTLDGRHTVCNNRSLLYSMMRMVGEKPLHRRIQRPSPLCSSSSVQPT